MMGLEARRRMFLRRALVLGDGPLGRAIADDLGRSREMSVTVVAAQALGDAAAVAKLVSEFAVVLNALPAPQALSALSATIEANRLIADAVSPVDQARPFDARAVEMEVAACVGCGREGLAALLGRDPVIGGNGASAAALETHLGAWMATAWARRLLTGDFRGHWGVWTPERLAARVGMRHAVLADLGERGIDVR